MTESNMLRNHPAPGFTQLLTKLLVLCYVMSLSFQLHLTDKTLVFYLFYLFINKLQSSAGMSNSYIVSQTLQHKKTHS